MLIIQFPQDDDLDEDIQFTRETEALLTSVLEQAGLGRCDGFDIGSGSVNFFCTVTDSTRACACTVDALQRIGLDDFVVADDGGPTSELRVIWPPNYVGSFSVF